MVSVWLLAKGIPPLFCKVGSGNAAGLLPEVVDGRGEIARVTSAVHKWTAIHYACPTHDGIF